MKRKKIYIVGNWKCNPTYPREALRIFNSIASKVKNLRLKTTEVVICPPFVYLDAFGKTQANNVRIGAQNCFWEEKGAFTGEISPVMLKKMGCKYVIVGHSERRKYFSEKGEALSRKIKLALKTGLCPILCIDKKSQIKAGLAGLSKKQKDKVIVAYEPIWAIGTGKTPTYKQAGQFHLSIKKILGRNHPVLYGGSVNSENALGFIQESQFEGLLIGGASLKPDEFSKIIKIIDAL